MLLLFKYHSFLLSWIFYFLFNVFLTSVLKLTARIVTFIMLLLLKYQSFLLISIFYFLFNVWIFYHSVFPNFFIVLLIVVTNFFCVVSYIYFSLILILYIWKDYLLKLHSFEIEPCKLILWFWLGWLRLSKLHKAEFLFFWMVESGEAQMSLKHWL